MSINEKSKQTDLFRRWQKMVIAQIRHAQAEQAQKEGDYPLAIWLSEEAYRLCDAAGYPHLLPPIRFRLGQSYNLQGNPQKAHQIWSDR